MNTKAAYTLALDAMGGDYGPKVVVPGAEISRVRHPNLSFLMFGIKDEIEAELSEFPELAEKTEIIHTDISIPMDMKPSQALRQGRHSSSMWLTLKAVKEGKADAAVSAGNTGALMAMSKFCLKTMPGIERPAIAAIWPTVESECIVLDVGANVGATAQQLFDFALMGAAMSRAITGIKKPRVGLLNVGVEEIKGVEEVKAAANLLKNEDLPLNYQGFVEGNDLGHGVADVIVTEGFSGNIALKTAEGTAKQIGAYLKAAMNRSLLAKVGAFLAQDAFKALKAKMDPRQMNGGTFLGFNGIVIKSHGGTDPTGFASAVDLGYDVARSSIVSSIAEDIDRFHSNGLDTLALEA